MDTKALRQKVLDLAIRGKLVPQNPNDEPASVLLERIRQQKQQMVKEGKLKAKDIKNDTIIFVGEDNLHYEKFADGSVKCIEDEIPFDLPEGWAWARLGAVAEAIGDGDHQPPPQTSFGVPFLVISNVSGGQLSFENTRFVSEEYFSQLPETRKPRNGDLLFTVTGSFGIPVLVDTDDKFCFQRHIAIVRPCIISNRYLYVVLGSSYVKSICDAKATGTAQKTVGLATLRELLIPVAPYKEQMQIYAQTQDALSIVDSLSSDKEDLLNIIENAKAKILDLAIRGQLVPQDPDDEPASVLLERIRAEKEELIRQGKIKRDKKESVIFRGEDNSYYVRQGTHTESIDDQFIFDLPDNWKWCSLLNVAKIELGKTLDSVKNTGTNHPYLRSVNVRWNEVDLADLKEMRFEPEEVDRYTVRRNDLLICEGGDVGRSCVWTDEKEILYQNALHRVRFYGECNPFYFMYYMMYYESRGIIKALCKGVTIKHLTGNVLSLIPFALPPLEEQGRIVERLNQMFALLDTILCD